MCHQLPTLKATVLKQKVSDKFLIRSKHLYEASTKPFTNGLTFRKTRTQVKPHEPYETLHPKALAALTPNQGRAVNKHPTWRIMGLSNLVSMVICANSWLP